MSEALRKADLESQLKTLAEKGCGKCFAQDCAWPECSVKAKALKAALAEPEQSEPKCNPHPKAPHGFDRNGSHSVGRYVCECEHWNPYDAGYQKGLQDGLERAYTLQEISDIGQLQEAQPRREPLTWAQVQDIVSDAGYYTESPEEAAAFVNGIRHAEDAHGITGEKT